MPLTTYSGSLGKIRAAHLLRRATFGPTKDQIDTFAGITPASAIGQLFATAEAPVLPIDPKTGVEWVTTPITGANSKVNELEDYFISWQIGLMLNPSLAYSAREKIVFFLHTHFTTIKSKVSSPRALYYQNELFRKFALDKTDPLLNIKELTKKISVDNAMIRLLDGDLNVKGNPNENYARELLELYTIGKGLEGSIPPVTETDGYSDYANYSERDIQIAALVLSGWNYDNNFTNLDVDTTLPRSVVNGSTTNASSHDNTVKTFSANHFGGTAITPDSTLMNGANPTEASALDEIDQLIEMVYAQPETAKSICRKVYRYFCNREITPALDTDIIAAMANIFTSNNFKLQPVLEALLTSTHFYDSATMASSDDSFGGIIKSPLDLAVGALRILDYQLPDMATATVDFYEQTGYILAQIREMGMPLYEPTDVAGYDAYHQWPIYHRAWISPNYLAARYKYIENITNSNNPAAVNINLQTWIQTNFNSVADDATALAPALAEYFYPVPTAEGNPGITDARYAYFRLKLIELFDDTYWATLWNGGQPDLVLPLTNFINAMLQSPEYQLQ